MVLLVKYVHAFCTLPFAYQISVFRNLAKSRSCSPPPSHLSNIKDKFFYSNLRFFQLDDTIELSCNYPVIGKVY